MPQFGYQRERPFAGLAYVHIVMIRVTWFRLDARTALKQAVSAPAYLVDEIISLARSEWAAVSSACIGPFFEADLKMPSTIIFIFSSCMLHLDSSQEQAHVLNP